MEVVVLNNKILYIPNAFSPNGDGINDYFQPSAPGGVSMKMSVYDRWGEEIFTFDGDMTGNWDGKYKGDKVLPDVYVYYIEVTYLDGQKRTGKGSVVVIK